MTTIIAIESKNGINWAWDSRITMGNHVYQGVRQKVFRNGDLVFGVAGLVRDSAMMQYMDLPDFYPKQKKSQTDKWVTRELIPALRNALHNAESGKSSESQYSMESICLVSVKGRMYQIDPNLGWIRRKDGVYIVGSGAAYARGALMMGATPEQALRVASECDSGTGHDLASATNAELMKV